MKGSHEQMVSKAAGKLILFLLCLGFPVGLFLVLSYLNR